MNVYFQFNAFNMIRFLAALQVLLVHAFNHYGFEGNVISALKLFPGVPVFFFVSGLMIYGSYERNRNNGLLPFYINRFLRIYPALWVCVFVSTASLFVAGYLSFQTLDLGALTAWLAGQTTFLQFYNPDFMRGYGVGVLNGALWTIAVELQFYIIAPLLYCLFLRSRLVVFAFFLLSIIINILAHNYFSLDSTFNKLLRVSFLPWVYIFILGFAVAHFKDFARRVNGLSIFYLLAVYILTMFFLGDVEVNSSNSINFVSATLLGLLTFKFGNSQFFATSRFARLCDKTDISYGLYLYHMPVINFIIYTGVMSALVGTVLTVLVSFVLAIFSWFVIEKPALRLKKRFLFQDGKYKYV